MLVNCSSGGLISLDRDRYTCDGVVNFRVVDCDLNTDDGIIETVTVNVTSDESVVPTPVGLTETGAGSAAFEGSISLALVNSPGSLLVGHESTVTASYLDTDDGAGGVNVVMAVTALADCVAPEILNVGTVEIVPRGATIEFETSEPATGSVRYGTNCAELSYYQAGLGLNSDHEIQLTELLDDVAYYYAVDVQDAAGNQSIDDGGGNCYSFRTPVVADYFAELFGIVGGNDLGNTTIMFTPDGSPDYYSRCSAAITSLPTDPAGGTVLDLDDDDYESVTLTGGMSVSLYGTSYIGFFPASNGYISFNHGQSDSGESLEDHFNLPRISALFDDLNPERGGPVVWQQFSDRVAVTWQSIPEFQTSNSNTFQIEMFFDGRIRMSYLEIAAVDGLAGLSKGERLPDDFYPSDLSASGVCDPQPPSTQDIELVVDIDTWREIELIGFDFEGGVLDYTVTVLPEHGLLSEPGVGDIAAAPYTLSGSSSVVVYTPDFEFAGDDSFEYTVNDGTGDSNTSAVSILVLALSPVIATTDLPDGIIGAGYGPVQLQITGGQPVVDWSMVTDHVYRENDFGSCLFTETSAAQGWHDDDKYWFYTLPFGFPYYGEIQTTVRVWSNGFLNFGPHQGNNAYNSFALLKENKRICPLWDDLKTTGTGEDIFIDESVAGEVTIRWKASTFNGNHRVNFLGYADRRWGHSVQLRSW